jgi:hypothetical protein
MSITEPSARTRGMAEMSTGAHAGGIAHDMGDVGLLLDAGEEMGPRTAGVNHHIVPTMCFRLERETRHLHVLGMF